MLDSEKQVLWSKRSGPFLFIWEGGLAAPLIKYSSQILTYGLTIFLTKLKELEKRD